MKNRKSYFAALENVTLCAWPLVLIIGVPFSLLFWQDKKRRYQSYSKQLAELFQLPIASIGIDFQEQDLYGYSHWDTYIFFAENLHISEDKKELCATLLDNNISEQIKVLGYKAAVENAKDTRETLDLVPFSRNINKFVSVMYHFSPDKRCIKIGSYNEKKFLQLLTQLSGQVGE